jgi:RNA polymerase sigma factor (sigma-70 family)
MGAAEARSRGRRQNGGLRQLKSLRVRRARQATDSAFESFYREHVAEVYQYALAVLSNPADAEDVTQQTFLNAYRAFQNGERPHTPHNWLIKIAHNVCRMRWRQASRRPPEVALENAPEPAALDEEKPSVDDILRALARLPFNQRAAVVMREVEGRTYAEIADVLNTTVPAVEALLFRARTNLRSRRKALGVLTLVPLPGSLSSFFGGSGGGLAAAGGAIVGSDLLLKAAAVVATSVVAGGLGFKTVQAVAKSSKPKPVMTVVHGKHQAAPAWADPVRGIVRARVRANPELAEFAHPLRTRAAGAKGKPGSAAPTNDTRTEGGLAAAASGSGGTSSPSSPGESASSSSGSVPATTAASETVRKVVASVPTPTVPPTPPPPVSVPVPVPPPPTVSVPSVTVTVPTVPVPTVTLPSPLGK